MTAIYNYIDSIPTDAYFIALVGAILLLLYILKLFDKDRKETIDPDRYIAPKK